MKAFEAIAPARPSVGVWRVWQRNFRHYRKTWLASLLWTCLEPFMYLVALGFGLGAYVQNIQGRSYVEFFFPGLLCMTAMTVAFFETTYAAYPKLRGNGVYAASLLSRISAEDIALGEIFWSACKAFFGCVGIVLAAALFGLVDSIMIVPGLVCLFVVSWLFASLGLIATAAVQSENSFVYFTSGVLIPMSLLSGIYFPIEQLPLALQAVSWTLPLAHASSLTRGLLSGQPGWIQGLNFALLLVAAIVAGNVAVNAFRRRLLE